MSSQVIKYSYARIRRRWRRPARGFRLSTVRLSVLGLRTKLWTLMGLMGRCARNVRLLTRGLVIAAAGGTSSATSMIGDERRNPADKRCVGIAGGGKATAPAVAGSNNGKGRRPPCVRSNSFYARAVAECLDFIKGSNTAPVQDSRGCASTRQHVW